MSNQQTSDKSQLLTDLSPYVYGTTRLGDEKIPFDHRTRDGKDGLLLTPKAKTDSQTHGEIVHCFKGY